MNRSHEIQGEARHRCHGFGLLTLAAFVLLLTGCERGPCVSSLQCAEGYICMTWKGGTEETRTCAKPCPVEDDFCSDGSHCYCPDSPAKARCFDEDGERIAICGG